MTHKSIASVADAIRRQGLEGGFAVAFPEYRPDQFQALAHALGLPLLDYRAEFMAGFGWDADRISLRDLDDTLMQLAEKQGQVVQNIEALLATKSGTEREAWFRGFLSSAWPHSLVLPIAIMTDELPETDGRVLQLAADALPEQSFLNRLAF